jgi:hypothetical protein
MAVDAVGRDVENAVPYQRMRKSASLKLVLHLGVGLDPIEALAVHGPRTLPASSSAAACIERYFTSST